MKHDNNFNLLRLLAAAQVVYMHSVGHLHLPYLPWLHLSIAQFPGVAVFFVISGFLVSDSFLRSTVTEFFFKRTLRIYPALIVNILVLEYLLWSTSGLSIASWPNYLTEYLPTYLATASMTIASNAADGAAVYTPSSFFTMFPSGVLWTLTVELSFYLVLPLFLAVVKLSKALGTIVLCVAAAASFSLANSADLPFYNAHDILNITVPTSFWIFAIGIMARLYWEKLSPLLEGRFLQWAIAYAIIAFAAGHLTGRTYLDFRIAPQWPELLRTLIMGTVVLSAAFSFPSLTRHLRIDKNDFSYGLYLWHMLVVTTLIGLGFNGQWWLWPIVYGAGLALASISWFLVERPTLGLKINTLSPAPAH